jgi:hypothetical protein
MSWGFDRAQAQHDADVPAYLEEGYAADLEDDFDEEEYER